MKQRYINTKFWEDSYVADLDPTEKLVFLYLLTNSATNICGIYELPVKRMSSDTGYEKEMVLKILARFEADKKIKYESGWVAIKNFIKHQNGESQKVKIGINSELKNVPASLVEWVMDKQQYEVEQTRSLITKRQAILIRDDFMCRYCGKEITENADLQIDHIQPASRGGSDTYENMVCSCARCNNEKSDRTAIEYCGIDVRGERYHTEQAFKKLRSNSVLISKFKAMFSESMVLSDEKIDESTISHLNSNLDSNSNSNLIPDVPAVAETKDEEAVSCTQMLYNKIKARTNPPVWNTKPPKLESWYKDVEAIHRIDGMTYDNIRKVIEWATADQFWKTNILSAATLRKQFNQLYIKMNAPQRNNQKRGYDPNDSKQQDAMARILGRKNANG